MSEQPNRRHGDEHDYERHREILAKLNAAADKLNVIVELAGSERREIHLLRKEIRELLAGNPDAVSALTKRLKTSQEALSAATVGAENPGPVPPVELPK